MPTGKIKFFNESKGFGFITPDDGSADVFVHSNDLKTRVRENDNVQYDLENGKKGVNAANVVLI